MSAVLSAPAGVLPAAEVAALTGFRFRDACPSGPRALCATPFRFLPEFVQDIVVERLSLAPREWDVLVERGETLDVTGCGRYTIPASLRCVRRLRSRTKAALPGVCEDCHGSSITLDADASLTGTRNAPTICPCSQVAA